ncbi:MULTISPECIES: MFS transporter [unclassified Haematobacter]|uniref:MFS transporter n=1 Tax=unclassified Haematobacter TaxID=2640585 RepID=UPI0025C14DEC|nr:MULTISPECIES: MFS transporter [unclassified Haematobacter]
MHPGLICLVAGYLLSQFYRSFLAVLAPVLAQDIGATPEVLARASGFWFLAFAACQLPIGWALDRVGPRLTSGILLGLCGGGGALIVANARGSGELDLGMALIGVGCAPILVAGYYIIAREFPPRLFATMASAMVGLGMMGDLGASLPLAWSTAAFGWRATMAGVAVLTVAVAVAVLIFVRDPARLAPATGDSQGLLRVLRPGPLWLVMAILVVGYAPVAAVRGLWVGPYLEAIHHLDPAGIGLVTSGMAMAMAAGTFAYGPLDRILGTRKWVVLGGALGTAACFALLAMESSPHLIRDVILLLLAGLFGMSYGLQMAHGRAFFPPHLTGRGVAVLNLFSVGAVGLFQMLSGRIFAAVRPAGEAAAYSAIFSFLALSIVAGCAIYAFAPDRTD